MGIATPWPTRTLPDVRLHRATLSLAKQKNFSSGYHRRKGPVSQWTAAYFLLGFSLPRSPMQTRHLPATGQHPRGLSWARGPLLGAEQFRAPSADVLQRLHGMAANDMQNLPAFGQVSIGGLKLILSGSGASGARPMPDGRQQEPGGWNRVLLRVQDLPARIAELKQVGLHFRNEMEVSPGGKQIQIEDPDGNPIELFEPARRWSNQQPVLANGSVAAFSGGCCREACVAALA
jgi:glyoxylase I family protein